MSRPISCALHCSRDQNQCRWGLISWSDPAKPIEWDLGTPMVLRNANIQPRHVWQTFCDCYGYIPFLCFSLLCVFHVFASDFFWIFARACKSSLSFEIRKLASSQILPGSIDLGTAANMPMCCTMLHQTLWLIRNLEKIVNRRFPPEIFPCGCLSAAVLACVRCLVCLWWSFCIPHV